MFAVRNVVRREFPHWNQRAKIRKVDQEGNIVANEYAFAGEAVRVSPRYQRGGVNYRIRPERPAYFFCQFCVENGLLPTALTPEECDTPEGLAILEQLWAEYKLCFPKLESPYAASDEATEPSLKVGYSFNIPQVLVEPIGAARANGHAHPVPRPGTNGAAQNTSIIERITAMRARNNAAAKQEPPAPTKKK